MVNSNGVLFIGCLLNDLLIAAVANMLHLNSPEGPSTNTENIVWKVLIFDKFGQDIISSIMRVNDLRENGITVHM